jgi:hypothetical protein
MLIEKSNDLIGNQTRDFPVYSIVPQSTTLQRAPKYFVKQVKIICSCQVFLLLGWIILSRVLFSARGNNNVDSLDSTREFIATIAEITHNRYNTQFRVW